MPVIANAPADLYVRDAWLERLLEAVQADEMPYIEGLGEPRSAIHGYVGARGGCDRGRNYATTITTFPNFWLADS